MLLKSLISVASLLLVNTVRAATYSIPNHANTGAQTIEYTAKSSEFDGQKITPYPNGNSYEWWYFDAVSSTTSESVTIVFFETNPTSFITGIDSFLSLQFAGTRADGSKFIYAVPAKDTDIATVTTNGDGASGVWGTTGFSFAGNALTTKYTVEVSNDEFGIYGTFVITTNGALSHGPCGIRGLNKEEKILPNVGWSNPVPDSNAVVNMTVAGIPLSFTGLGYHDKNWGDVPFTSATQSWYWGHGRVGPFSIVWFDALDQNHNEYTSGYVSIGPLVLEASCAKGAVSARPYGANSAYPPPPGNPPPTGFNLVFDLGIIGKLNVQAAIQTAQINEPVYGRYLGPLTATLGPLTYTGKALFEEFKFPQA